MPVQPCLQCAQPHDGDGLCAHCDGGFVGFQTVCCNEGCGKLFKMGVGEAVSARNVCCSVACAKAAGIGVLELVPAAAVVADARREVFVGEFQSESQRALAVADPDEGLREERPPRLAPIPPRQVSLGDLSGPRPVCSVCKQAQVRILRCKGKYSFSNKCGHCFRHTPGLLVSGRKPRPAQLKPTLPLPTATSVPAPAGQPPKFDKVLRTLGRLVAMMPDLEGVVTATMQVTINCDGSVKLGPPDYRDAEGNVARH